MHLLPRILSVFLVIVALLASKAYGGEAVRFSAIEGGKPINVEGYWSISSDPDHSPTVIILHHAGGYDQGTTKQYAAFFSQNGVNTFEVIMFKDPLRASNLNGHIDMAYASLKYLIDQKRIAKNRVSVMGLSYGGMLTINAITKFVDKNHNNSGYGFSKFIALYPVCWVWADVARNNWAKLDKSLKKPLPWTRGYMDGGFINKPLLILAGGKDDYEGQDSEVCGSFVNAMKDEGQKILTEVVVYPNGTHGWDQSNKRFETHMANKGSGGSNFNRGDKEITKQGMKDILIFLNK